MNSNVPEKLKQVSEVICYRFCIDGQCDLMYICNVIAYELGIGNGEGEFYQDIPSRANFLKVANVLFNAYGCNILQTDIVEVAEIIMNGSLNVEKAKVGLSSYIEFLKSQNVKFVTDEFRVEYNLKKIAEATKRIEELNS